MAENKKGFILYADQKELFQQLPNEKAGELIKHIFSYVNDEDPQTDDLIIKMAFTPIKQQFKRDLAKWEETRSKRSAAGKASAEARRNKKQQSLTNSTSVKSVQHTSTKSTVNDNVNVKVNDNVKESIIYTKDVYDCLNYSLNFFPKDLQPKNEKQADSWLDTLEKLNRIDKHSFDDIKKVVKETRENDFWAKNFLSIKKLRSKNKDGVSYYQVFKNQIKGNSTIKKSTNWWDNEK